MQLFHVFIQTPCTGLQYFICPFKIHTLVYDIFPPTTVIIAYATSLSAQGPFFVGAQIAVSLKQTTQNISDVSFITAHSAHLNTNKTGII